MVVNWQAVATPTFWRQVLVQDGRRPPQNERRGNPVELPHTQVPDTEQHAGVVSYHACEPAINRACGTSRTSAPPPTGSLPALVPTATRSCPGLSRRARTTTHTGHPLGTPTATSAGTPTRDHRSRTSLNGRLKHPAKRRDVAQHAGVHKIRHRVEFLNSNATRRG